MSTGPVQTLTDRQQREKDYHVAHAAKVSQLFKAPNYDVITSSNRRWWNGYWDMWTFLRGLQLRGAWVLVVGCGAGEDALRLAKCGAIVSAFDLSPEMLAIGTELAEQEGLAIKFAEMPAEKMTYRDSIFDLVLCRDILHHVDIPLVLAEINRVAKPRAMFVVNEIYSHSWTEKVRHSWLVEKVLYPAMRSFVYQDKIIYITEDERKMTEEDIALVKSYIGKPVFDKYFNFLVTRIVPDKFVTLAKIDRIALKMIGPLGRYLAGRIVFAGYLNTRNLGAPGRLQ